MTKVLTIPDLHEPFTHPKALQFVNDICDLYQPDQVVFIGDVVDGHAVGRFSTDPNGFSPGHEYDRAVEALSKWHDIYPNASVVIGNHDDRLYRRAFESGLPRQVIKEWNELWQTPTWNWGESFEFDGVKYIHGTGRSGMNAALRLAMDQRQSVVCGHTHVFAGVAFHCSDKDRIFGLNAGCLLDVKSYSMAYAKHMPHRPVLGLGLVTDGRHPMFVEMPCSEDEPYHRDKKGLSWTKRKRWWKGVFHETG